MAIDFDVTTDRGKVRLLISDGDLDNLIFEDEEIDAFISMALNNNIKRAAAMALRVMAANENYVQKAISVLDLKTDGPKVAAEFRAQADRLDDQADKEEASEDGASFDWAEMVTTPHQYDERLYKEALRDN